MAFLPVCLRPRRSEDGHSHAPEAHHTLDGLHTWCGGRAHGGGGAGIFTGILMYPPPSGVPPEKKLAPLVENFFPRKICMYPSSCYIVRHNQSLLHMAEGGKWVFTPCVETQNTQILKENSTNA